ncbi:hypothetical protein PanWU01x14_081230, partial [Parasponia andersonii]
MSDLPPPLAAALLPTSADAQAHIERISKTNPAPLILPHFNIGRSRSGLAKIHPPA